MSKLYHYSGKVYYKVPNKFTHFDGTYKIHSEEFTTEEYDNLLIKLTHYYKVNVNKIHIESLTKLF